MQSSWTSRVEDYVDRLMELSTSLDEQLDQLRLQPLRSARESDPPSGEDAPSDQASNSAAPPPMVTPENSPELDTLAATVQQLEAFVAQREALLRASDAPRAGQTLTQKLLGTHRIEDARLAKRCRDVSEQVETTHQRAMALFVCQFHLANFGHDLLKLLSGAPDATSYGQGKPARGHGGGLFNDAA